VSPSAAARPRLSTAGPRLAEPAERGVRSLTGDPTPPLAGHRAAMTLAPSPRPAPGWVTRSTQSRRPRSPTAHGWPRTCRSGTWSPRSPAGGCCPCPATENRVRPRPRTSASRRHPDDDDPAPRRPVNGHGKVDQCWCPASRARRSSADQSDGCGQRRVRAGERHQREDSDPGGGSSQGRGPSRPRRATRSLPAVVRPLHAPGLLAGLSLRGPNGGALAPLGRRYLGGPRGMFM